MKLKITSKRVLILVLLVILILVILIPKNIFTSPGISGSVISRVFVSGAIINHTCNFPLFEDWNLISIACIPDNKTVENVFSQISGNYQSIHAYKSSDQVDPWKIYNPNLPSYVVHDLENVNEERGYWIFMDVSDNLSINGTMNIPGYISLSAGWNLVGYEFNDTKNISDALSNINGKFSKVLAYNATEDYFEVYDPSLGNNTLTEMRIGMGFWINTTQSTTWFIEE